MLCCKLSESHSVEKGELPVSNKIAENARRLARMGQHTEFTSGMAPSFVQGNVVILPQALATDFELFCHRNSSACPILAISEAGDPTLPSLGQDIDIRTDLPRYCVWDQGSCASTPLNISDLWRDDLVTFVLGCSFSFEEALVQQGVKLRHLEENTMPAAYKTTILAVSAGCFHGPLVVSMRALSSRDVIRAVQITTRYPAVHGAPIHIGNPRLIGISDIESPDYGEPPRIRMDEIPVFWACGVTPQSAIFHAKPDFCITHSPGCMLITDLKNASLALF